MTRSRLRNCFLKNRSEKNRKLFCKQRNKCVSVLRKSENDHFANLNEKTLQITNVSGKPSNPSCQKKFIFLKEQISTDEENNSLLTNCEEVAKELNNFFANAVKNLNISNYENCDSSAKNIDDPNLKAIAKWRNHPSILAIASEYKVEQTFLSILFLKKTFLQK